MSVNNSRIKITSWNVRGLGKLTKLKQVINKFKDLRSKIVFSFFLQDIHLMASDIPCLKIRWPGQVIYSSYNNSARGVAILLHKSVPFQIIQTIKDFNCTLNPVMERLTGTDTLHVQTRKKLTEFI